MAGSELAAVAASPIAHWPPTEPLRSADPLPCILGASRAEMCGCASRMEPVATLDAPLRCRAARQYQPRTADQSVWMYVRRTSSGESGALASCCPAVLMSESIQQSSWHWETLDRLEDAQLLLLGSFAATRGRSCSLSVDLLAVRFGVVLGSRVARVGLYALLGTFSHSALGNVALLTDSKPDSPSRDGGHPARTVQYPVEPLGVDSSEPSSVRTSRRCAALSQTARRSQDPDDRNPRHRHDDSSYHYISLLTGTLSAPLIEASNRSPIALMQGRWGCGGLSRV